MVLVLGDGSLVHQVGLLQLAHLVVEHVPLFGQNLLGMLLSVVRELHVLQLLGRRLLVVLEIGLHVVVALLEDLDSAVLFLVFGLLLANLLLHQLLVLVQAIPFVVELVFQGQDVLVQRDLVLQQGLVRRGLILDLDLLLLETHNLSLHDNDLLLQVVDVLLLQITSQLIVLVSAESPLLLLYRSLQVGEALELLVPSVSILRGKHN